MFWHPIGYRSEILRLLSAMKECALLVRFSGTLCEGRHVFSVLMNYLSWLRQVMVSKWRGCQAVHAWTSRNGAWVPSTNSFAWSQGKRWGHITSPNKNSTSSNSSAWTGWRSIGDEVLLATIVDSPVWTQISWAWASVSMRSEISRLLEEIDSVLL